MAHYHVYYDGVAIHCAPTEADVRILLQGEVERLRASGAMVIPLPDGMTYLVRVSTVPYTKILSWLLGDAI